ncbi:MAG: relaxase domain-containing protein [Sphingobacteriales bacterium JAD_PAG50586_3]|nr:MAG: relaxase domain-containing protein [Sphingobacteriales bacterium JAD_PAG50586_3]
MIRMIQSSSAAHAKSYFNEALSKSDYYLGDQELAGTFQGKLKARLGLDDCATKEGFYALAENINPKTGRPLTSRTKEERRIGYDINFHCPKSVSILHALSKDDHILKAFQSSVRDTMFDIEKDAKARIRKGGASADRQTGELVWGEFIHQTARPVEGFAPDPHLHSHCFVFNATWDDVEKQFKAGQFGDIKRDMPYYQAVFHKRFSDQLMELGYRIKRTDKSFEVEGVPQQVIDLFSKRTDEIGRVAKEKGIADAKEISELGARTRSAKQKGASMADLRVDWRKQIDELGDTGSGQAPVRFAPSLGKVVDKTPSQCVDFALSHSFERASVMADRRILATAHHYAIGKRGVTGTALNESFAKDSRIIRIKEKGKIMCTTREVLAEEKRMVELAQNGRGKIRPLYKDTPKLKAEGQQAAAIEHVLTTSHLVSIIRGVAGAGKTTLMQEAVMHITKAGKEVYTFAPSTEASRGVLRKEGFQDAETVARLLLDTKMQSQLKDQVLWVDEAGLLGTKDMLGLLKIAEEQNAQLILGGDTRQHASVVRGDALRILNTVAGIKSAEVNKIYRQKNIHYRHAVEDLSKGNIGAAFGKLDEIGFIKTVDPLRPNDELVADYLESTQKGKSALIISPTHKQGAEVTGVLRQTLRYNKLIGKKEIKALSLDNLNLTQAQKTDWRNYKQGQLIQFEQNLPQIKRGSTWEVESANENGVVIKNAAGKALPLPLERENSFGVYSKAEIGLSKGDKVMVTKGAFDKKDKRLNNGQALEVVSVAKNGTIKLQNKISKATYTVDKDFGHIKHGYCVTSYASQGKTVDEVFISQPAATFPATDAKQFYVSVSRAKDKARIYTDDKEALLEYASEMGDRQSAMELVYSKELHLERIAQLQREQQNIPKSEFPKQAKDITNPTPNRDDYEPV